MRINTEGHFFSHLLACTRRVHRKTIRNVRMSGAPQLPGLVILRRQKGAVMEFRIVILSALLGLVTWGLFRLAVGLKEGA
jgi:type IV secretory pathway TrbD component